MSEYNPNALSVSDWWVSKGLTVRAANVLTNAGLSTFEDVRTFGRKRLAKQDNCGSVTLDEIGRLLGGWPVEQLDPERPYLLYLSDEQLIRALNQRGYRVTKDEGS